MKIASKEAREALFWLLLCKHSKGYPAAQELLDKLAEIRRLLSAIIFTSKKQPPIIKLLLSFFGL